MHTQSITMNKFPTYLKPENQQKFKQYAQTVQVQELRKAIYLYMLTGDKKGFDLRLHGESDIRTAFSTDVKTIDNNVLDKVREELHSKNWQTMLAYGNTTLYIFVNDDDKPVIDAYDIE